MPAMDASVYAGPIVVTVLYVLVYYGAILNVARVKGRLPKEYAERGERFDRYYTQDRTMLAADRVQLNMLEQMPPFLVLHWLNAVFVGVGWATVTGAVYLVSRVLYPVMVGSRMGRGVRISILAATGPGYLVILAYGFALLGVVLSS